MRNHNRLRIKRAAPAVGEARVAHDGDRSYPSSSPRKTRFMDHPFNGHKETASSSVRVAIKEQVQFPTHQGMVSAQRVRTLRIKQPANSPDQYGNSHSRNQCLEQSRFSNTPSQHELPPQPLEIKCRINEKQVRLRAVGEIAADEEGNFYEIQGQQTRRLGKLVMDEQGRVFEVHPASESQDPESTKEFLKGKRSGRPAKSNGTDTPQQQTQTDAAAPVQPHKKQPRSKARAQKTPAIQPSARETHSKAQINESRLDQSQEEKSRPRLWPVIEPTAAMDKDPSKQSVRSIEQDSIPRHEIPQKYRDPLQFKYSRQEVLYDMKSMLGTLPPESGILARWLIIYPLRRLKTFTTSISSRRSMKKWRAMLKGKRPDDQLWAVTPPRGFSYLPAVRYWAEERLSWAGYDPERMLLEWEIFWRRRGTS